LNQRVVKIDPSKKVLYTYRGNAYYWDKIVSTIPINELINTIENVPNYIKDKVSNLDCLSLKVGMVVINRPVNSIIQRIYSNEEHIAAHKIALNHNSSDTLRALPQNGVMCEMSVGSGKTLFRTDCEQWILDNLMEIGVLNDLDEVKSVNIYDVKYAYPVPTHRRDEIISELQTWLNKMGIYSVGRFGEWAYINSDEAFYRGMKIGESLSSK